MPAPLYRPGVVVVLSVVLSTSMTCSAALIAAVAVCSR